MANVTPVEFVTPDGVSRELRFTRGAKRRIVDRLGVGLHAALEKYDSGAFPEILYAMMHDVNGKPPADLTVESLAETIPDDGDDDAGTLAAIMAAATQGRATKNDLEPLIRKAMEERQKEEMKKYSTNGSTSGPSARVLLALPINSTGGDTSNAKSSPESISTENTSADGISALPASTPPSAT